MDRWPAPLLPFNPPPVVVGRHGTVVLDAKVRRIGLGPSNGAPWGPPNETDVAWGRP
jgi:hypothetical protein